jgi:acyl carrier protein
MTEPIAAIIRRVLGDIAADVDIERIDPHDDVREAADLDSVDFLNFVAALHDETGVDIPERDYAQVRTLAGCEAYLASHLRNGAG